MRILLSLFAFLGLSVLHAQSPISSQEHQHSHKQEVSLAVSPTRFFGSESGETALSFHMEYARQWKSSDWAFGLAYEHMADDHQHRTYGLILQYRFNDRIHMNVEPGVTRETHELGANLSETHWVPAAHTEFTYEWELGRIDVGPFLELAVEPGAQHLGFGLHIAIPMD